jgi:hypothetical protein
MVINYDSEDEDLISHISKRSNFITSEIEIFLKAEQASALTDPLNWWKVNYFIYCIFLYIKY